MWPGSGAGVGLIAGQPYWKATAEFKGSPGPGNGTWDHHHHHRGKMEVCEIA